MKGNKDEDARPSKDEIFDFCGPLHLTCVDWNMTEHRRSVAASLVKGVYLQERDRQKKRKENNKQAPKWWEFFSFECIETLEDKYDSSIFGAIFKYKKEINSNMKLKVDEGVLLPPKYVIAFRGTMLKRQTMIRDCYMDAKIVLKGLDSSSRYELAIQKIEDILEKEDPKSVWLAGHSLGAAIGLQTGKIMAEKGYYIETYLFNPPYASPSLDKLFKTRIMKGGARIATGIVRTGLSLALKIHAKNSNGSKDDGHDPNTSLHSWIPHLFVNPEDPICRDYSGYFEKPKKDYTALNVVVGALGRDEEAHLIPSALVVKNMKNTIVKEDGLNDAHGLCQWWEQHSFWHAKVYRGVK